MQRRAFLTALGFTSYGGLGWLLNACSEGTTSPSRLNGVPIGSPSGTEPANKPAPTDGDEYVPGNVDAGAGPVVQSNGLPNASWESRVKQLESGAIYTEAAPGPWVGKERSHVPVIVADTVLTNRVTVLVNHVMQKSGLVYPEAGADAAPTVMDAMADGDADGGDAVAPPANDGGPMMVAEHYITTIYVKTDTGVVAGLIEMSSSDPAPPTVTFVVPAGTKTVTAYEYCNLHGLWASKPLTVKA